MKKVLLYSGGMDSWLISQIWKPDIKLYVNMHTRYSEEELKRISNDNTVTIVDFPLGQWEQDNAIIPLRNLYLVMVVCNITGNEDVEICLGATAGDRVLDKSNVFVEKTNELLNFLYQPQWWIPEGKTIKLNIDFKSKTKSDLIRMYLEQGGAISEAFNQSFSCYNPINGHECWHCKPCFRKFVSFELNGYKFNSDTISTVINYINTEIKPQILNGSYGRGKEEEQDILSILDKYKEYIN